MKKLFALLTALTVVVALAACGKKTTATTNTTTAQGTTTAAATTTAAPTTTANEATTTLASEAVTNWADYMAAEDGTKVELELYVQAKNSWWNTLTLYACDAEGNGVFIYEMTCTEEQAASLTAGTKIKVTGERTSWSGEVEIASGSTFEVIAGAEPYVNTAVEVSVAAADLDKYMNRLVKFSETFTVVEYTYTGTDETTGEPVTVNTNKGSVYGSKEDKTQGGDVYFMVEANGTTYTFLVRSYLTNSSTDVYKAAEALQIGDQIKCEGYAYWWNGINPHITDITILK